LIFQGMTISRKALWYGVNLAAMGCIAWNSSSLWHFHLKPGDLHSSGPGEGFYFFFLVMIPWLLFLGVNIILLIRRLAFVKASGYQKGALMDLVLVASWIT